MSAIDDKVRIYIMRSDGVTPEEVAEILDMSIFSVRAAIVRLECYRRIRMRDDLKTFVTYVEYKK